MTMIDSYYLAVTTLKSNNDIVPNRHDRYTSITFAITPPGRRDTMSRLLTILAFNKL